MTEQIMKKKTVRLPNDIVSIVETKDKPSVYMRNAIEKEVKREQKAKTKVTVIIKFAGIQHYSHHTLEIETFATGRLKEKMSPLLDAVERLQEVILYLDP